MPVDDRVVRPSGDAGEAELRMRVLDAWEGLVSRVPEGADRLEWLVAATGMSFQSLDFARRVRNQDVAHRHGAVDTDRLERALDILEEAYVRLDRVPRRHGRPAHSPRVGGSIWRPAAVLLAGLLLIDLAIGVASLMRASGLRFDLEVLAAVAALGLIVAAWIGWRTAGTGVAALLWSFTVADVASGVAVFGAIALFNTPRNAGLALWDALQLMFLIWFTLLVPGFAGMAVGQLIRRVARGTAGRS